MDKVLENHFNLLYTIYLVLHPDEIIFQAGVSSRDFHLRELTRRFSEIRDPLNGREIATKISSGTWAPSEAVSIGAADFCVDQYLDNPACFERPRQ